VLKQCFACPKKRSKWFSWLASFFLLDQKETKTQAHTIASAQARRPGAWASLPYCSDGKLTKRGRLPWLICERAC